MGPVGPPQGPAASGGGRRRPSSGESRSGRFVSHAEQFPGDRGVVFFVEGGELLLETAHLGAQGGVLLGYSQLVGSDDRTEQGLGHGSAAFHCRTGSRRTAGRRSARAGATKGDTRRDLGQRHGRSTPVSGVCRLHHLAVTPDIPWTASSRCCTSETRPGACGPDSSASTARTSSAGPSRPASTRPSGRLVADPASPRAVAARRTNQRYPTPCTCPSTRATSRNDALTPGGRAGEAGTAGSCSWSGS